MKKKKIALLVALAAALAAAPRTRAQETPGREGAAPVGSGTAPVGSGTPGGVDALLTNRLVGIAPGSGRDPFSTSARMHERAAETDELKLAPGRGIAVPKLALRGYAEPKGKPAVALIEVIGQGVYPVRAGDTIGLTASGRTLAFKVEAVDASGVRVQTGTLGQVIVIR